MHCTPTRRQSNNKLWFEDKIFPWIRNMRWFLANQTTSPTWEAPCHPNRPIYLCKITSYVYPARKTSLWILISPHINSPYSQPLSGRTKLLKKCQNLRLVCEMTDPLFTAATLWIAQAATDTTAQINYHLQMSWKCSSRNLWGHVCFALVILQSTSEIHFWSGKKKIIIYILKFRKSLPKLKPQLHMLWILKKKYYSGSFVPGAHPLKGRRHTTGPTYTSSDQELG